MHPGRVGSEIYEEPPGPPCAGVACSLFTRAGAFNTNSWHETKSSRSLSNSLHLPPSAESSYQDQAGERFVGRSPNLVMTVPSRGSGLTFHTQAR